MTISKKDYVKIAKKLAAIRPYHATVNDENDKQDPLQKNYNRGKWQGWAECVNELAYYFFETNPKFDKELFIEACND